MADMKFGDMTYDPFEGRTTATERPTLEEQAAMVDAKTSETNASGEPVGGNEDPADAPDPLRNEEAAKNAMENEGGSTKGKKK